ncbi:reproductive homeobox on X chromosome 8 [Rattus norvegicus]|uniref:Reproductive homeobox on X chromosome 8 n=1 Tax=Rattus norvegicus TaxID=10116 RepID=A6JMI9_RAT|nr:reproductive homeobox on X chromosome 8 [Rattus norvegicus]
MTEARMAGPAAMTRIKANKRSQSLGAQKAIRLPHVYQASCPATATGSPSSSSRSWSAFSNVITILVLQPEGSSQDG